MPVGGRRPGAGRPKGSQNRITRTIRAAIERTFDALQRDPKANLWAWAKENPGDFYKLAARLIPQEIKSDVTLYRDFDVTDFDDDELAVIAAGKLTDELVRRLIVSSAKNR